jgi:hypothetical protein
MNLLLLVPTIMHSVYAQHKGLCFFMVTACSYELDLRARQQQHEQVRGNQTCLEKLAHNNRNLVSAGCFAVSPGNLTFYKDHCRQQAHTDTSTDHGRHQSLFVFVPGVGGEGRVSVCCTF